MRRVYSKRINRPDNPASVETSGKVSANPQPRTKQRRKRERKRGREGGSGSEWKRGGGGELMNERVRGKFPACSKQHVPGIHFLARQRERSRDRFQSFKG